MVGGGKVDDSMEWRLGVLGCEPECQGCWEHSQQRMEGSHSAELLLVSLSTSIVF